MSTTASKYYLRRPTPTEGIEPAPPDPAEALVILVAAGGYAACPEHEVGPVANHLRGPVAAVPSVRDPSYADMRSGPHRTSRAVNSLIGRAGGAPTAEDGIHCTCGGISGHPLFTLLRHLSQGRLVRPHFNTRESQERVATALHSGDVDFLTWAVEPRLEALKNLSDRARTEHGGPLPEEAVEALAVILGTLAGPRRWDVRAGLEEYAWPLGMRAGLVFETCDRIVRNDFIHDAVLLRLVEGK